jgi:AcrR family transcriptional regulator
LLISAGERLFAARGIDGVSLREIMREAGVRNASALQYHFGNRDGLVRAIMDKHASSVHIARGALLDHVGTEPDPSLRSLARVFIDPLISKLNSDDGGPEFLQRAAQLVNRSNRIIDRDSPAAPLLYDDAGVVERWSSLTELGMPPRAVGPPLHRRFAAIRFAHIELGRRAGERAGGSHALFASQLTDLFVALLGAEVSAETRRLLR